MEYEKKDTNKNAQPEVPEKGFGQQNKRTDSGSTRGSGADQYDLGKTQNKETENRRQANDQSGQSPQDQKV